MQMIDDATWAGLDPSAGAFTRRQRLRATLAVLAAALVAVLAGVVSWSGVLSPRLALESVTSEPPTSTQAKFHTFNLEVILTNKGLNPVKVLSVGRSGSGLRLVRVVGADSPLPGSTSETVELTYRVTNCAALAQG